MSIRFSPEQQQALTEFRKGTNICITGPGGTGKSLLINKMYEMMDGEKVVAVTALTGCAAFLLASTKARTIHSWSGIYRFCEGKVTDVDVASFVDLINSKRSQCAARWVETDILIIDEISMMSQTLFTLLDRIGRVIRSKTLQEPKLAHLPFGGIQVVFVGDFLQIPPVIKGVRDQFLPIFDCPAWHGVIRRRSQVITLKRNYRASKDETWARMLLRLRQGECDRDTESVLRSRLLTNRRIQAELDKSPVKPTVLVSTHAQVDRMNNENLVKCPAHTETTWKSKCVRKDFTSGKEREVMNTAHLSYMEKTAWKDAIESSLIPQSLILREGAQVMCLHNVDIDMGLVNGARGVVTRYDEKTGYPVVNWKSTGYEMVFKPVLIQTRHPAIFIKQIPLCQAWAITIHKSQGQTLDCAEVDIGSSVFVPGQSYVALSRVGSVRDLYIRSFNRKSIKADPYAKRFCEAIDDT